MNTKIINYMNDNNFTFYESENQLSEFIRIFEMCPVCKNIWALGIRLNGEWCITNEFGHICWENGYIVTKTNFKSRINFPPWNSENSIPEIVNSITDVDLLVKFIKSYQHTISE